MPALIGPHQLENAGAAIAALRLLGFDEHACEAAMRDVTWPARMQRLRNGPLVDAAGNAELWLDGGHNPAAGETLARVLRDLPKRPTHLICGMLNTKDIAGYLRPLANVSDSLAAVSIPGEANTLPAEVTAKEAISVGMKSHEATSVGDAITQITQVDPDCRILICGSLYLAGDILKENG